MATRHTHKPTMPHPHELARRCTQRQYWYSVFGGTQMIKRAIIIVSVAIIALSLTTKAHAEERTFASGSLVIPMDRSYQDTGLYQAYGLLYELLRQGVPVTWVIDPDKTWHHAPCDTVGDECAWDCDEQGSGVKCDYPTASPDFFATTEVVWSDAGTSVGTAIIDHGYRGGPFVIAAANRAAALDIINAWNDQSAWAANPWASRDVFEVVTVHETTSPFTAFVKKQMIAAPTIAVFADGNENIATAYLRAAGIPQSNGMEFPANKCGNDDCGPGTDNPDMLTVPSVAGDMGTCDAPNMDHRNGALFKSDGTPAYCQIMSMHWGVKDREKVECGGGACPDTAAECTGVPITYHGHEVVAEVRSFLRYPTHFFAECQAVNAYENTVPNPEWPYLDDDARMGHFLTTVGTPPSCPCNPGAGEGEFECVTDGCGPGNDCCLPKDDKELGAGFLIAETPDPYKVLRPDVAYMQFDGDFEGQGGSEPAYNLSTYLNTTYHNDRDVTFITAPTGPGVQDVWMTGYLDGECDVEDPPIILGPPSPTSGRPSHGSSGPSVPVAHEPTYCGGKISYLGGHSYVGKAGQRLFLNALFEADCVTNADWPGDGGGDSDGDGIPDTEDPAPNDPNECGDSDGDTCDDCVNGSFDPANDGPDADGDGICDAGDDGSNADGDDSGGCGCRTNSNGGTTTALILLGFVLALRRKRRLTPTR